MQLASVIDGLNKSTAVCQPRILAYTVRSKVVVASLRVGAPNKPKQQMLESIARISSHVQVFVQEMVSQHVCIDGSSFLHLFLYPLLR